MAMAGGMSLGFQIASSVAFVLTIVILVRVGFRSLRNQVSGPLHRSREEDRQLGHGTVTTARGAGAGGSIKKRRRR